MYISLYILINLGKKWCNVPFHLYIFSKYIIYFTSIWLPQYVHHLFIFIYTPIHISFICWYSCYLSTVKIGLFETLFFTWSVISVLKNNCSKTNFPCKFFWYIYELPPKFIRAVQKECVLSFVKHNGHHTFIIIIVYLWSFLSWVVTVFLTHCICHNKRQILP